MRDAELLQSVLAALDHAPPDATVEVLRPLLADHLGATGVRLLLANCELTALRPVLDPDSREVLTDTPAGAAFVTQEPVTCAADGGGSGAGVTAYLPLTVRGDRIGVLQLTVPDPLAAAELRVLQRLAGVVGYAVQAAARHTDAVHRGSRSQRLTLAAELQWQLLPGRGSRATEYELAAHLEPAYRVHADNYDWSHDGDRLVLSVTDAARRGNVASLLTTLAVTAMRNARRAGIGLADQAALADQAIYAHHQGREYISTLLLAVDLASGHASAVLAGSPRLFILRDGQVLQAQLTDEGPLGMFEGTEYTEQEFDLVGGDRLLMVSDGIHAARSPGSEPFGGVRLPDVLRATATAPVGAVVRILIEELFRHRDLAELEDDAAVLCLDWAGRTTPAPTVRAEAAGATSAELRAMPTRLAAVTSLADRHSLPLSRGR